MAKNSKLLKIFDLYHQNYCEKINNSNLQQFKNTILVPLQKLVSKSKFKKNSKDVYLKRINQIQSNINLTDKEILFLFIDLANDIKIASVEGFNV